MRHRQSTKALWSCATAFAILLAGAAVQPTTAQSTAVGAEQLQLMVDGPQRSADNRARDRYRQPGPVLAFFEVTQQSRVVEILPGSAGYWTEILAPLVKDGGQYTAAIPKPNPDRPELMKAIADIKAKLAADPASFGRVATVDFSADGADIGAPGSMDYVLTFRSLHNWMAAGRAEQVLATFHRVLQRGGILGIEEHRGRTDEPQDPAAKTGYVREDYALAMIEKAGFRFVAKSEVNANPNDTKDYAAGVWTLPPTYRLKDQDREKYTAIGESDRFLMKFVKP